MSITFYHNPLAFDTIFFLRKPFIFMIMKETLWKESFYNITYDLLYHFTEYTVWFWILTWCQSYLDEEVP